MIYLYEDFKTGINFRDKWERVLSNGRRRQMYSYHFPKDQFVCMIAFVLLRYSLYREYGIKEMPQIQFLKNRKPFLWNTPIKFNFSHCDNAVLCAVDWKEIGVDIQNYTDTITEIKNSIVTDRENVQFSDKKQVTRLWTLKEAYGKYCGVGLGYDLKNKDFSDLKDVDRWQNYEKLNVYSKQFEHYALSVFSESPMRIYGVYTNELNNFCEMLVYRTH